MKRKQSILNLCLAAFGLLAGCVPLIPAEAPPAVTATPDVLADCFQSATAVAWLDENGDGLRDDGEPPLPGIEFVLEPLAASRATSDENGVASLSATTPGGVCPENSRVRVSQFDGYLLNTPAALDYVDADTEYLFGFRSELSSTTSCATVTEIPQSECEALFVLVPQDHQLGFHDPCSWGGIECNNEHVTSFQWIILNGNASPEIGNLTNLTTLYIIGDDDLVSLPPEIGNLTNLTTLDIGPSPNLSSLPPEIGNLVNLTSLIIQEGQQNLTSLPPEIGNLTNLTDFYFFGGGLNSLPPEIGNLTNLVNLGISASNLSNLPPEIDNLTNLAMLTLENNDNLSSLPPELCATLPESLFLRPASLCTP
jgi:Leucine-rich repeat (LRR) protein